MQPTRIEMAALGSDCIFNGRPKGETIEGSYLCLHGGGLIEGGIWRAGRNY
jgi:hypothetical protein